MLTPWDWVELASLTLLPPAPPAAEADPPKAALADVESLADEEREDDFPPTAVCPCCCTWFGLLLPDVAEHTPLPETVAPVHGVACDWLKQMSSSSFRHM
jgi:hypothetical protein